MAATSKGGTLTVYGASDDLLEFEGAIDEEWTSYGESAVVELHGPHRGSERPEGLIIVGTYTDAGTWSIGVAPLDDDLPLPDWGMRLRTARSGTNEASYSAVLELDIPAGTTYVEPDE